MLKIYELISWAGLIVIAIFAIISLALNKRTQVIFFMIVIGSIIFLVGQLLMLLHFKTVWGRACYLTGKGAYIGFGFWLLFFLVVIIFSLKNVYRR
ncbi:MAG TPA: hypothetical protein PL158_13030 [Bacillota bacterium]|nr:hypothetical protein [Bacillota bacterium]HOL11079.1 hypothetical protein [Bacillota bacterium]